MKNEKKFRLIKRVLLTIAVLVFANLFTVNASAADYKEVTDKKVKTGKYYVWNEMNPKTFQEALYVSKTSKGSKTKVASKTYGAFTDGSSIYYAVRTNKNGKTVLTVYKYSIAKKERNKVASFTNGSVLEGVNKKELIIFQSNFQIDSEKYLSKIYSYNMTTKKKKTVSHILPYGSYGNRYIIGYLRARGAELTPLYVYDIKTGKNILVEKRVIAISAADEKDRYYYLVKGDSRSWCFDIKKKAVYAAGKYVRSISLK